MSSITKILNVSKSLNSICKNFNSLTISAAGFLKHENVCSNRQSVQMKYLHTTPLCNGLMEFFDEQKNWGENEVRTGRSWKLDELRIKSNTDLHKLWFVLLKEHNMLLTMEEESKEQNKLFPSPERLDKVRDSMKNLEDVVRERNKAYHLLETGEVGERPGELVTNQLGLNFYYRKREHLIPKSLNKKWKLTHNFNPRGHAVYNFQLKYREKLFLEKKKKLNRDRNHVIGLMRRFPNMDMEAVKEQYPDVDIDKCRQSRKARGHFVPQ